MAASTIYTGPWLDRSKSTLMAPTLTVTTAQAFILTSFLAVFITIFGAHLWGLVRYTLHQFRVSRNPEDAMYHQEQLVLRNSSSPSGAAWELFKIGSAWRRRPGYGFRRVLPLLCVAALQALLFTLAGIYSSDVFGGSAVVLVESQACGYIVTPTAAEEAKDATAYGRLNAALVEGRLAAEASLAYARACYGNGTINAECNSFLVPRLPASYGMVACPFANETCLESGYGALKADSGYIYTDTHLGINSAKEDSLAYRRVTTCAPIRTDGYSTWRENSEGVEQYLDFMYSKSSSIAKRQDAYNEYDDVEEDADEELAEENYAVDEAATDEESEVEEVPADGTLASEEFAEDDGVSDEDSDSEETYYDDEEETASEEAAYGDEESSIQGSNIYDTTAAKTTSEETPALTKTRPGKLSSETSEYEANYGTQAEEEVYGTTSLQQDTTPTSTTTPDEVEEFKVDTATETLAFATTIPEATSALVTMRPRPTKPHKLNRPQATTTATAISSFSEAVGAAAVANALKNATSWMDKALDTNKTYSYTNENQTDSLNETETTTGAVASTMAATFTYDTDSANYINTAYPIDHYFSSLGSTSSSTFTPITNLSSSDADVTLIFLTKNAKYVQPVEDIWFNATIVSKDTSGFSRLEYTSADPVAVMACTEQHQICDPTLPESTGCSALTGWAALQASQQYSGARLTVADDLAHAVSNSLLSNMVQQLGSSAILASLSVAGADSLHSAALPTNQWQLEVESWTAYSLAHLQRLIASVATGPVLTSSAAYITAPTTSTTSTTTLNTTTTSSSLPFSPCHAQKILHSDYYSFPVFPLSLTLAVGSAIILLNLLLAPLLGLLSTLTGLQLHRKEAWEADHAFQLQRLAYEGANLGTWNGSAKGAHVPTTVYSAVKERFGRPGSGAKGVYEMVEEDGAGGYDEEDEGDVEKEAYGDGGKGYAEKSSRGRESMESGATSLADEDVRGGGGAGAYRDASGSRDPYAPGADMGIKMEEEGDAEEEERLARKRW